MVNIEKIIEVLDNEILKTGKPYLTLVSAKKVLKNADIISFSNTELLKELLQNGSIPHAYQTESKPKQWRIPISNPNLIKSNEPIKYENIKLDERHFKKPIKLNKSYIILGLIGLAIFLTYYVNKINNESKERYLLREFGINPDKLNIDYSVIKQNIIPKYKFSQTILLQNKISEKELTGLALKLKYAAGDNYENYFFEYLLPRMIIGNGAWATTHFMPDLKVKILGLSLENEIELLKTFQKDKYELVGQWVDDFEACLIRIYKQKLKYYIQYLYVGDMSELKRLELINSDNSNAFKYLNGDELIIVKIDLNDDLEFYDDRGLIYKAVRR